MASTTTSLSLGHTPNASTSTPTKRKLRKADSVAGGKVELDKKRKRENAAIRKLPASELPELFTRDRSSLTEADLDQISEQLKKGLDPENAAQLLSSLEANGVTFQAGYDLYLKELFRLQIEESVLRNVKLVIQTEFETLKEEENKLGK